MSLREINSLPPIEHYRRHLFSGEGTGRQLDSHEDEVESRLQRILEVKRYRSLADFALSVGNLIAVGVVEMEMKGTGFRQRRGRDSEEQAVGVAFEKLQLQPFSGLRREGALPVVLPQGKVLISEIGTRGGEGLVLGCVGREGRCHLPLGAPRRHKKAENEQNQDRSVRR